ncbi:hypothetical protein F4778DRAFT_741412 [Xylariomycetidae sp. FL2044]|nr:hypothetical protein F4778DRAFT_741412 [Xylariomycetidae sp. FL2044]
MSSSSGLSRTRSLRKPAAGGRELGQKDAATAHNESSSPSRLPVKPPTRSFTSSTAATSSTTTSRTRTASTAAHTSRPLSGVYSKRIPARNADQNTSNASSNATKPLGRAPSTRQAPPVASRTTTAVRPRSSGGPPTATASKERQFGHSRAKSTVTNLTAATTLRPLSHISSSTVSTSSGSTTPTSATFSKPQTRSQTHARSQSHSQSAASITQPLQQQQPHRPAFNTNQQHYSPAKSSAPKPLTSTFLAPPSPSKQPTNIAISAETSRLQTELLQLSLMHRDAAAVEAQWHASARQKLGARFRRLAGENAELARRERGEVEDRNIGALIRWGEGEGRLLLEERVQTLDQVLSGVWALGEPGGRYQRVARGFEAWAAQMAEIVRAQRAGDVERLMDGDDEVVFLSELDRGWKAECAGLLRKLDGWRRMLRGLGDVEEEEETSANDDVDRGGTTHQQPRSGLSRMLEGCRHLVDDMHAELSVMEQIERDAARAESAWIEKMNEDLGDDDDTHIQDTQTRTPRSRRKPPKENVPLWKMAG